MTGPTTTIGYADTTTPGTQRTSLRLTPSRFRPFLLFFGVLLPTFTIVLEATTGFCAGVFFDPVPTIGHTVLASLVPAFTAILWICLVRRRVERYRPLLLAMAGVGLAMVALLTAAYRLREQSWRRSLRWTGLGLLTGMLAVTLVHGRYVNQYLLICQATSVDQAAATKAMARLRSVDATNVLLRASYGLQDNQLDPITGLLLNNTIPTPERSREVFYRVVGKPFETVVPPGAFGWRGSEDLWAWDEDQGQQQVGRTIRGLSMVDSRMDGIAHAEDAWLHIEWTMVFRNDGPMAREARAEILLPPGGVVSRLTLWIDGQPQEAAFGPRERVTRAYQSVVVRQRDPVLVNSIGPDRILVQCFPVMPNGGQMKTRIGITAPLRLLSLELAELRLPRIIKSNFRTADSLESGLWIETASQVHTAPTPLKRQTLDGKPVLVGVHDTRDPQPLILRRDASRSRAWAPDPTSGDNAVVVQELVEMHTNAPARLAVVIDGSAAMADHRDTLIDAIKAIADGLPTAVLIAGDSVQRLTDGLQPMDQALRDQSIAHVQSMAFIGGMDNVPALQAAWDSAAGEADQGAILWLHGPQPLLIAAPDALAARWEHRPGAVRLIDMQPTPSVNRVLDKLHHVAPIVTVAPDQITSVLSAQSSLQMRRTLHTTPADDLGDAHRASSHIVRLWAFEQTLAMLTSSERNAQRKAANHAVKYQLVTPVSAAVVLETAQQYADAGLEPVDPDSVPVVPEPSGLMLAGVATWLLMRRRRDCASRSAHCAAARAA